MEKIKYQEMDFDSFQKLNFDSSLNMEYCTRFLFHGTRLGLVEESEKEISFLHQDCDSFMSYLNKNIHSIFDSMKIGKDERYKMIRFLHHIDSYHTISNFEYGDFYLTSNFLTSIDFSNLGAGELCELCYQCIIDIQKAGIVILDENINAYMQNILKKYVRYSKTERVVLSLYNVPFCDLANESGSPIAYDFQKEDVYEAEVNIGFEENYNFRLKNVGQYCFYLFTQKDFLSLIPCFTNIQVDEIERLKKSYSHNLNFLFNN